MTATATPGLVLDVTETAAEKDHGRLATPADLYRRWERQQWAVADVAPHRDRPTWDALTTFTRSQVSGALAELEVGEVTVTRTLGALIENPPTEDDRIYLCTQLADEARHVRFFQTYIEDACGISLAQAEGEALAAGADYAQVFAPALVEVIDKVRADAADRESWYRALVFYHLITEGVLAATGLRTTRFLARRLRLEALDEGLTNVTRDESRHVSYGLRAAEDGVLSGYGNVIRDAHLDAVGAAAWVLVGPSRHNPVPAIAAAATSRAVQLRGGMDIARERLLKQLRLISLPELAEEVALAWDIAVDRALDAYADRWNAPHPVRAVPLPAAS